MAAAGAQLRLGHLGRPPRFGRALFSQPGEPAAGVDRVCHRRWAGAGRATCGGAFPRAFERLIDTTLQAIKSVPTLGWVPLLILWFGIDETPKLALIAIGAFFPVYVNIVSGIRGVDTKLVEVGRVFCLGRLAALGADRPACRGAGVFHGAEGGAHPVVALYGHRRADGSQRRPGVFAHHGAGGGPARPSSWRVFWSSPSWGN